MKRIIAPIVTLITVFSAGVVLGIVISSKVSDTRELSMYAHQLMGLSGTLSQMAKEGEESAVMTMNSDLCSLISIIYDSKSQMSNLPGQTIDLLMMALQSQGKKCGNYNALIEVLSAK